MPIRMPGMKLVLVGQPIHGAICAWNEGSPSPGRSKSSVMSGMRRPVLSQENIGLLADLQGTRSNHPRRVEHTDLLDWRLQMEAVESIWLKREHKE